MTDTSQRMVEADGARRGTESIPAGDVLPLTGDPIVPDRRPRDETRRTGMGGIGLR